MVGTPPVEASSAEFPRLAPKRARGPPPPYTSSTPLSPEHVDERTSLLPPTSIHHSRSNVTAIRTQRQTPSYGVSTIDGGDTNALLSPLSIRSATTLSIPHGYFDPLFQAEYYRAALHLGIINFPFALLAWIYLFVGTLVGTTLLLMLPFGVLIWWITLLGARTFTRWELSMQSYFHCGRQVQALPLGLESQLRSVDNPSHLESADTLVGDIPPAYEPSFLQKTYAMFLDPASYQPLFYFIVIKASTTLLMTPLVLAVVPVSLALILPAPWVLRMVRRLGLWQADLAIEGLSPFRSL